MIVDALIKHGANVHTANDRALRVSTRYGHFKIVKLLVEAGANVNANSYWSHPPLFNSIIFGDLEIVEYLLDNHVDVNHERSYSYRYVNAKTICTEYNRPTILKLLVERGFHC